MLNILTTKKLCVMIIIANAKILTTIIVLRFEQVRNNSIKSQLPNSSVLVLIDDITVSGPYGWVYLFDIFKW